MSQSEVPPSSSSLLVLNGVNKSYPALGGDQPISVLKKIDWTMERDQTVAVVGPSGCGKSTLLHLIGLMDRPSSGEIKLDGQKVSDLTATQAATLRCEMIGFIFQDHYLLPQCTVMENVLMPTLARRSKSKAERRADQQWAKELLMRVGLEDRLEHRPSELSGGQAQRVAVVRALINRPVLLLADEPTGALDERASRALVDLLLSLQEAFSLSLLMVTHAKALADQMQQAMTLVNGRLEPVDLQSGGE